nr:MAG TPA: hypothetical protein [Caudoviricetes sp.]
MIHFLFIVLILLVGDRCLQKVTVFLINQILLKHLFWK